MSEQTILMLNTPLLSVVLINAIVFVAGIKIGQFLTNRNSGGGRFITNVIKPNRGK